MRQSEHHQRQAPSLRSPSFVGRFHNMMMDQHMQMMHQMMGAMNAMGDLHPGPHNNQQGRSSGGGNVTTARDGGGVSSVGGRHRMFEGLHSGEDDDFFDGMLMPQPGFLPRGNLLHQLMFGGGQMTDARADHPRLPSIQDGPTARRSHRLGESGGGPGPFFIIRMEDSNGGAGHPQGDLGPNHHHHHHHQGPMMNERRHRTLRRQDDAEEADLLARVLHMSLQDQQANPQGAAPAITQQATRNLLKNFHLNSQSLVDHKKRLATKGGSGSRGASSGTSSSRRTAGSGSHHAVDCAICQDTMREDTYCTELPCTHFFCHDCIMPWLEKTRTCPVCRLEVGGQQQQQQQQPQQTPLRGRLRRDQQQGAQHQQQLPRGQSQAQRRSNPPAGGGVNVRRRRGA